MSIERLIQIICGFDQIYVIKKVHSDISILISFAKQISKGVSLTDRQGNLAEKKLKLMSEEFKSVNIDIDRELMSPFYEMGVREIDREQKIFIVNKDKKQFIGIKFPFNKKTQSTLRTVERHCSGFSQIDGKINLYTLNENNIFYIVKTFKETFIVDTNLLKWYEEITHLKNNQFSYYCGESSENQNLPRACYEELIKEIGVPSINNCHLVADRRTRFGYTIPEELVKLISEQSLSDFTKLVSNRPADRVFVNYKTSQFTLTDIVQTINELNRWPCLIVFGGESTKWAEDLQAFLVTAKGIVENKEISVLTRLDSQTTHGEQFNTLIKSQNLNNIVDKYTKCVIIDSTKIPKFLVKDNYWNPMSVIFFNLTVSGTKVQVFSEKCDLRFLYGDKAPSSNYYEC